MSGEKSNDFIRSNSALISALDAVHDMALVLDEGRKIIHYNKNFATFAERYGLTAKLGLRPGNAFNCIHAVTGDDRCGTTDFCQYCGGNKAISESIKGESCTSECNIVSLNGNAFDLRVTAAPLDLDGERYTLYCLRDVSSESRKKMLEKIFFHDINNIVGGISLISELLSDNCDSKDQENINNMNLLVSAIESLKNEIQAQRIITMAEKDELSINLADTCISEMLGHVTEFFKKSLSGNGIAIEKIIKADETCISTDPVILKRVVTNTVKNACEASNSGQKVTISYQNMKNKVVITVHNEAFMSDAVSKSIFKKSFSTKGEGRGFGTYSMRLLTERYLKGSIYFRSGKGEGTTFYIELPVKPQD